MCENEINEKMQSASLLILQLYQIINNHMKPQGFICVSVLTIHSFQIQLPFAEIITALDIFGNAKFRLSLEMIGSKICPICRLPAPNYIKLYGPWTMAKLIILNYIVN